MRLGERRKFKTSSHLYSRTVIINFFRLCWVVLVIWGELGTFFWSLSSCKWPEFEASSEKPTRVLLVSDPQVRHLSGLGERPSLLGYLRYFIFDLNLKKSWHVTTRIRPHIVMFLGDMLANGKNVNDESEYRQHFQKFKSIFALSSSVPAYYIPGNNDVGMGVSSSFSNAIRDHYLKTFGLFNQRIVIKNHTFILLDAPGLVDEDYRRTAYGVGFDKWNAIPGGTVSFVKTIQREENPLILLSHIALSRPDTASCGSLREKGTIRRGVGHGYQNTLGKQTTVFLFKALRPSAIYSGDNRDYCEYIHTFKDRFGTTGADVREVTVKSFSMANHIRRPGFQLLSLIDPSTIANSTQTSFLDRPCLLPDQYGIYTSLYAPFFILTVLVLLVIAVVRRRQGFTQNIELTTMSPQSSGESTPSPIPESATWSPHTPTSPRGTLPSYLRTPTALAGPTFRASRPTTPLGSPLLPPMLYTQEDDYEAMYPTQYATRRDNRSHDAGDWSPEHIGSIPQAQAPHFTSAPVSGLKSPKNRGWLWSWTFVFRGKRRRMTVRAPIVNWNTTFNSFFNGERHMFLRHDVLRMTIRDGLSILWPVVIVWVLLTWSYL